LNTVLIINQHHYLSKQTTSNRALEPIANAKRANQLFLEQQQKQQQSEQQSNKFDRR